MGRMAIRALAGRRLTRGMAADCVDLFHDLARSLLDPYRPEQHYMRGPGPKWHAKHDPAPAAHDSMPNLIGLRVEG